jgi:hypothetical protein
MAKAGADFRRAVQLGTKQAGSGLKMALRQQVRTANLGTRMEKTWQDEVFPKSGNSANAAVIVYSKAPKIIAAFDNGVYIKSKSGTFLAIPTKNAPRRGFDGKQVTPTNWPEHRFGKLRLVKTKRALLLVADNLTASYRRKDKSFRGFRRASDKAIKANRRLATVVMFILVRQISLPKKLDVEREFKKWSAAYPALIERNLERASD